MNKEISYVRHLQNKKLKATVVGRYVKGKVTQLPNGGEVITPNILSIAVTVCASTDVFNRHEGMKIARERLDTRPNFTFVVFGRKHSLKTFNVIADMVENSLDDKSYAKELMRFIQYSKPKAKRESSSAYKLMEDGFNSSEFLRKMI